jgi:hypothetical protein
MSAVLCAVFAAATGTAAETRVIEAYVAGCLDLPSLEVVQETSVETLVVADEDTVKSWAGRARWRGLAPQLDVAVGSDADVGVRDTWQDALERTTTTGRALAIEAGARWQLGELIFSDAELRANREALARAATVQLARERVTKLYFERIEVALLARDKPSRELSLALARLDGLLRAATGGKLEIPRKKD